MRLTWVLGVIAACAMAVTENAAARTFTPLGGHAGPVRSDAKRYVAWNTFDGVTRVLDTRTSAVKDVPTPASCSLRAVGGGRVLFNCPSSRGRISVPRLVDVRSGAVEDPVTEEDLQRNAANWDSLEWYDVGAHWLRAVAEGYHFYYAQYWNRETGDPDSSPNGRREIPDLDSRELYVPLCAPLKRTSNSADTETTRSNTWVARFTFQRPLALLEGRAVRIQRCGQRKPSTLCSSACESRAIAAGGYVAWKQNGTVYVRKVSRRKSWKWVLPGDGGILGLTRHAVIVQAPDGQVAFSRF
jgi:hypothetical protein